MRVSPAVCNRVVDSARGILNQFVSDLYIYTDHCKGAQSGKYVTNPNKHAYSPQYISTKAIKPYHSQINHIKEMITNNLTL